jgi:hypothetical protein
MAQNFVPKQTAFVAKYAGMVQGFLTLVDECTLYNAEFTNDAYGTGGANAITDAIVQDILPASTAAQFNSGEGAMVTILATIATNRGYLEVFRT